MSAPDDRAASYLRDIARFSDALPVAIWVGEVPSGTCVYVNHAFRAILGIDPPEGAEAGNYVGPYSVHLPDGSTYPEDRMPYERVLAASVEVDDLVVHQHDGQRVSLRVYARPVFNEAGEISHVVEAFTDMSREVASRRAQEEREVQLSKAQRLQSLGGLAGGIAHDFNNLLMVIKMIATQLSMGVRDPAVRQGLARIDEVTDSAARLTRSFLDFAQQGKSLSQPVPLNAIVRDVAEFARRMVGRQITVVYALCDGDLAVRGDPTQFEQVLRNLVFNGKEAIDGPGIVTIRTLDRWLDRTEAPNAEVGRYAVIEVEDTGCGIPAGARAHIFEPYFTTKTAGAIKGTGLGLATAFGIVESHGGRISVVHTGPTGTTLRVVLPLLRDRAEPCMPDPQDAQVGQPPLSAGRGTVLVVDDEPLVLDVTTLCLETLGYHVLRASSGAQALELFGQGESVDGVVLDLVMPEMGGPEVFLAMKARAPAVQVLLITGYGPNKAVQACLDSGAVGLLRKPFGLAALSVAVAKFVRVPA